MTSPAAGGAAAGARSGRVLDPPEGVRPTPSPRPGRGQPVDPGRARLNPAAVVLWRGEGVLQLELDERRIVIEPVTAEQLSPLLGRPLDTGIPPGLPQLIELLAEQGLLTTTGSAVTEAALPSQGLPAQFGPDFGALTGRHADGAATVLANRRRAAVAVHGTSRITTSLAATLASAGVGRVQLVHGGEVAAGDACPGGLAPADEGSRFGVAGVQAVIRCAPGVQTGPVPRGRRPDLVILTDPAPVEPAVRASLHLDGVAHLLVQVDGSRAVVGPLVLPGHSSCLHCADLHRMERDPCWPVLAVQLSGRPRRRINSEVALCMATAGLAAGQALAWLDDGVADAIDATLEWQLPDWRLRRRPWPRHSECDCVDATGSEKHGRMER